MANSKPEKIDIKIGHRAQALDSQTPAAESKQPEDDNAKLDGGFSDSLRTHSKGTVVSPAAAADQQEASSDSQAKPKQTTDKGAQTKPSKQPKSSSGSVSEELKTPEGEESATKDAPEETYLAHGEETATDHDSGQPQQKTDATPNTDDHGAPQESARAETNKASTDGQSASSGETVGTDAAGSAAETESAGGTFSQPAQTAEDPAMSQSSAPQQEDFYSSKLEFDSQGNIKQPTPRPQAPGKRQRTTSIRVWLLLAIFLVTAAAGYVMLYQLEQADPGSGIIFEWLE